MTKTVEDIDLEDYAQHILEVSKNFYGQSEEGVRWDVMSCLQDLVDEVVSVCKEEK